MVRLACHSHEVKEILPLINWLKKSGYKVGVNIMQIPELSSREIENAVKQIKKTKADVLYFADSMGSLGSLKPKGLLIK